MDTFITVIGWIAGLSFAFMLLLSIGFSAGGAANTGNSELGIVSIASSLLLIYLIWAGVSSLFSSDDVKSPETKTIVRVTQTDKVKEADYDPTVVDVSGVVAPSTDKKSIATDTKMASRPATATKKNEFFDDNPYLLWLFYTVAFMIYASWLFQPSKIKGKGKDLVKQKLIASMTWKEDASGLKPWNPNWNPEDGDVSKSDK